MKQLYKWGGVIPSVLILLLSLYLPLSLFSCKSDYDDDSPTYYTITISSTIENGSVEASKKSASSGESIKLTAKPATGYELDSYSVTDSKGSEISVTNGEFKMPASNVTVSATFKETQASKNQKAADAVIAKINAIGTVAYTSDSKTKIDDARSAYDALTSDQKALVTNYSTLTTAESSYSELKTAADNQAAAADVIAKINAIGTVAYTEASKSLIDTARNAYDALTNDQKALVTNYSTLTTAESSYSELKTAADNQATAADVIAKINAIGTVAYTDACKALIDDARTAYDALTEAQQVLVTNYDTLTEAESTYESLIAYTVTLTGGANATVSGGATTQSDLSGAMTTVTYTASDGYYFADFTATTTNGITLTRTSSSVVTVSGTPTTDTSITVPDAAQIITLNITNPSVGQVIGSDGENYAADEILPADVTAVAKICYVSGSNGLALALADEGYMNWSTAIETCAAHTPAFTGGTWKLASKDEWSSMISAAGSSTALRDGFSSVGGTNMRSAYYWSATENDASSAWIFFSSDGEWNDYIGKDNVWQVRACLAFEVSDSATTRTLAEATTDDIGKIAGADGNIYDTKAAAEAVATGNAVAMIAYVGTASDCTHGLAIALADESGTKEYGEAGTACSGKAAVTGGTWRLPSDKDWQYMFIGCGSSEAYSAPTYDPVMSKSYSGLASKLTTAQGAALQSDFYWSSTKDDPNGAWGVVFDGSNATFRMEDKTVDHKVRACLAF